MDTRVYIDTMRLVALGWAILPVPHGWVEPRFEWAGFKRRKAQNWELKNWLAMDIGIGVVCGEVSEGLIGLEFNALGAYNQWRSNNPKLAATLPTVADGATYTVFIRLDYESNGELTAKDANGTKSAKEKDLRSGVLFLPGFTGAAGRVVGDGDLVVLPPTRHETADDGTTLRRKWQIQPKLGPDDRLKPMTYNKAGVIFQEREPETRESRYSEAAWRTEREKNKEEGLTEADRFGHLFCPATEYLAEPEGLDLQWIVEGFLPETYVAVLGGDTKSGKSTLLTALCAAVVSGEPFLGMRTRQSPVLWVAYEESRQERALVMKEFASLSPGTNRTDRTDDSLPPRASGLTPHASVPPNTQYRTPNTDLQNFYVTHEKLHTDTREGLEALRWWVRKTDAKLIVIDPLYAASTADSLSDGRSARNALSGLKDICRDERCAAVVLHHFTKDSSAGLTRERIADSSQILAVASMDLLFSSQTQQDGSRRIWLRGQGRGDFTNQTWLIESKGVTDFQLLAQGTLPEVQSYANEDAILTPLRESTEPLSADQIAKALNQNVRSLRNRLPKLIEQGRIKKAGQGGNTILYALSRKAEGY